MTSRADRSSRSQGTWLTRRLFPWQRPSTESTSSWKICTIDSSQSQFKLVIQWNLSIVVAHGPEINGCNREVAALKKCLVYGICQLGLKLSGCNKEVAALHSDHYTQV